MRFARLGAYVASATLAVTTVTAISPSAQAAPVTDPAGVTTAATWLAGQLTNGVSHLPDTGFGASDDYGTTIDIGLALVAANQQPSTVQSIATKLAANISSYAATPGAAAKSALFVKAAGGDPASFGGQDLVTKVNNAIATASPIAGRLENSTTNDFANTIVQAYAARVLTTAGASHDDSAVAFLLKQQCGNGGFRLSFTADKTASEQSCTVNGDAQLDATSIALRILKTLPSGITGVPAAITEATTFLEDAQQPSGAWGGDPFTSPANANSTGLAAWALGNTPESVKAATWLRDRQTTYYDVCTKMAGQIGAVAYDDDTLEALRSDGYPAEQYYTARSATAQALPALANLKSEITTLTPQLTGPTGYLKASTSYSFRVTGVPVGDELCLTTPGALSGATVTSTPWVRTLHMASGAIARTVTVRDRNNHSDTTTVKVLSQKTLGLSKAKLRYKRSRSVGVLITGLAPGERASLYFRGVRQSAGTADASGHFLGHLWTGRKRGKATVAGYGQFSDTRRGFTTIKVVK